MSVRIVIPVLLAACLALLPFHDAAARSPIALGLTVAPADSADMSTVDATIQRTGTRPALWSLWSNWGSRDGLRTCRHGRGSCAFPTEAAAGLKARRITPLIWWAPVAPPGRERGQYSRYKRIIAGNHDAYIRRWALDAKAHRGPIVLRFAHEANGQWYPWGLGRFDNSPRKYKQAWRHIWRIFRSVGARNVRFFWNPINEGCLGCTYNYSYQSFYPGNKFVDYVGMNAFNWSQKRWRTLPAILQKPLGRLRQVTRTKANPRGKPVILGEVSSIHLGGNKARWLRVGYNRVYREWPQVRGIVYLDVDMTAARQPDWRLEKPADGSALASYAGLARQPRFRGRIR